MPYAQIQIVDCAENSGIYEFRLNFDGTRLWTVTGDVARVKADAALISYSSITQSRLTTELISALGDVQVSLNDCPTLKWNDGTPQTGSFIREAFEAARVDGFQVTLLIGRRNKETSAFEEIVFRGSMNPREVPYMHRFIPKGIRRHETIEAEFTAAIDLDTHLSEIQWAYTDMASDLSRPIWGAIVCEPSDPHNFMDYNRTVPTRVSKYITIGLYNSVENLHPRQICHIVGYGVNPKSKVTPVPNDYNDQATGESETLWPVGNWVVTYGTAITKACEIIDWEWDGVLPDINARRAQFDNGNNVNEDVGQLDKTQLGFSFNYGFGISPIDGEPFKGPGTWDRETEVRQMFAHIAAQFFSRADISGYTSTGKPILSFVGIGQDFGAMPDMGAGYEMPESSEDSFVTDADGVEIVLRGFDGSVVAPVGARKPVKIEIPHQTHAIAYEVSPPFDSSRCILNASLDFREQWRCGYRGAIGDQLDTSETGTPYPLNPDGWAVGSLMLYNLGEVVAGDDHEIMPNTQFPVKHDQHFPSGATIGFHDEAFSIYDNRGWLGWYSPHAIYEKDRADLSDEERRARQKDCRISYAMAFGRYIRGERRRLAVEFKGVIAPGGSWQDIRTGQTYTFTPTTTATTYILVQIERNIHEDYIICEFEEQSPIELPMTYKVIGSGNKGTGSIDMNGGGGSPPNNPPSTGRTVKRTVKFYQGATVLKTLVMDCYEIFDSVNDRTVVMTGIPPPYDHNSELSTEDYGCNTLFQFHRKDNEAGNVEIVGISATDTPDYWVSGVSQFIRGTQDSDITYRGIPKEWNGTVGDFITRPPLGAANQKPRVYVAGRFKCAVSAGAYDTFAWETFATVWDFSNDDCKYNFDVGLLSASAALPTLAAAAAGIGVTVTWGTPSTGRFKPVTIQAQAWAFNPLDVPGAGVPPAGSSHAWDVRANPCQNQVPNVNAITIPLRLLNVVGGVFNCVTMATHTDLLAEAGLDELIFEFSGELEILGESA